MQSQIHILREELDQKSSQLNDYQHHRYQIARLNRALEFMDDNQEPPEDLTREFKVLIENIQTEFPLPKKSISQYDQKFRAVFRKARMHYAKSAPGRNILIGMFAGAFAGVTATLIWHLPIWTNSIGVVLGIVFGILADLYAERKGKVL